MAGVLISFREWLHSYQFRNNTCDWLIGRGSHLFQRVASFLLVTGNAEPLEMNMRFSSLSESGFIPTFRIFGKIFKGTQYCSHLFQRVASFLLPQVE